MVSYPYNTTQDEKLQQHDARIDMIKPFPEKRYCRVAMMNIHICRMITCKEYDKCHMV